MAHMIEDDDTLTVVMAKQVVLEETTKLEKEILEDISNLMTEWGDRLSARISARMDTLGIMQNLSIQVTWDPKEMPIFEFTGETMNGVCNG